MRDRGATVRVVMTAAARQFVSPLSAATLSGQPVRDDLFSLTDEARSAISSCRARPILSWSRPASANILARMAAGLADDLATTLLLATDKRVLVAPAMNVRMWLHPATRRNVDRLKEDGVLSSAPNRDRWPAANSVRAGWPSLPRLSTAIEEALARERRSANRPSRLEMIRVRLAGGNHCHIGADL